MVIGLSRATSVNVWGKPYAVSVYQKSEAVWVTVGEYMGGTIQVKEKTGREAVKRWIEMATERGKP
jgi:hypothetical protein